MTALTITRVVHSCSLLTIGTDTFLTDPWFTDKPLYHPGEPIARQPGDLPELSGILISHAHADHCDLEHMGDYADRDVPVVGPPQVVEIARRHGFERTHSLRPWESLRLGAARITATPAQHKVPEVTYVIEAGGRSVFFGGDSLYVPQLDEIPRRLGAIDLALLPTNGLRIRPLLNRKVVMDARDAAALTASLRPEVVVPHHYAFDSGPIGNLLLTKKDQDPTRFAQLAATMAPDSRVEILDTGTALHL